MGDFATAAAQLRTAAAVVEQTAPVAVNHGAFIIKRSVQTGIASTVGSDMELTEGGGIPVNVRYRLNGRGPIHTAVLYPTRGGFYWVERGTQAHPIAARRKKALAFGNRTDDNEVRRTPITHPGARRNPIWRQRIAAATAAADEAMRTEFEQALDPIFQ